MVVALMGVATAPGDVDDANVVGPCSTPAVRVSMRMLPLETP